MKKRLLNVANSALAPLGIQVMRSSTADLSMDALLKRLAQRNLSVNTIVDIGASNGKWSFACMKHFPEASFLAIEPLEERKASLESAKLKFANFDYAMVVAGDIDNSQVDLNVTDDLDGTSVGSGNTGISRKCITYTIDSLLKDKDLSGPYLLKFDTHGYELPILSGSTSTLNNTVAIIMEMYNFQLTPDSLKFHEMCSYLEKLGFRPADLANPMLRPYDHAFWQFDLLFLPQDSSVFDYRSYQ